MTTKPDLSFWKSIAIQCLSGIAGIVVGSLLVILWVLC